MIYARAACPQFTQGRELNCGFWKEKDRQDKDKKQRKKGVSVPYLVHMQQSEWPPQSLKEVAPHSGSSFRLNLPHIYQFIQKKKLHLLPRPKRPIQFDLCQFHFLSFTTQSQRRKIRGFFFSFYYTLIIKVSIN